MYPPTPTPIPYDAQNVPFTIPDISLWSFTDEAIQIYHSMDKYYFVYQTILVAGIIIGGGFLIMLMIKQITKDK